MCPQELCEELRLSVAGACFVKLALWGEFEMFNRFLFFGVCVRVPADMRK